MKSVKSLVFAALAGAIAIPAGAARAASVITNISNNTVVYAVYSDNYNGDFNGDKLPSTAVNHTYSDPDGDGDSAIGTYEQNASVISLSAGTATNPGLVIAANPHPNEGTNDAAADGVTNFTASSNAVYSISGSLTNTANENAYLAFTLTDTTTNTQLFTFGHAATYGFGPAGQGSLTASGTVGDSGLVNLTAGDHYQFAYVLDIWNGINTGGADSAYGFAKLSATPLPASAWSGLTLLGGLATVGGIKRLRRQMA